MGQESKYIFSSNGVFQVDSNNAIAFPQIMLKDIFLHFLGSLFKTKIFRLEPPSSSDL
jgi:hypothetical protein